MYKKLTLILFFFIICNTISFGQEKQTIASIFNAPDKWRSEIISFPINFAPEIDLTGFEELQFAPGWNDVKSEEFWTYSFVWYIDTYGAMSKDKLTQYFKIYYDGLMGIDAQNKKDATNSIEKTHIQFTKTKEGFSGNMKVYDNFFTKDYINLNIKVSEEFCPKTNKQIVLFDISPKAFDHKVWQLFDVVTLKVKCD